MVYIYYFILVLSIAGGWAMLWHAPKLTQQEDIQKQKKQVSIIIPARNEEKNISILLASLQKQSYKPLEILVVDDYSHDQTARIAREYGATVIQVQKDDREWFGKAAACWYGTQSAAGDTFLFLDADIFFPNSNSLARMIANFKEETVLSIQPYHTIHKSYENLSVIFNILVLAGMNQFSILGRRLPVRLVLLCSVQAVHIFKLVDIRECVIILWRTSHWGSDLSNRNFRSSSILVKMFCIFACIRVESRTLSKVGQKVSLPVQSPRIPSL